MTASHVEFVFFYINSSDILGENSLITFYELPLGGAAYHMLDAHENVMGL